MGFIRVPIIHDDACNLSIRSVIIKVSTVIPDQTNSNIQQYYWLEVEIRSKEFIIGSKSKEWENEVALMWHHFPNKAFRTPLKKILYADLVLIWSIIFVPKRYVDICYLHQIKFHSFLGKEASMWRWHVSIEEFLIQEDANLSLTWNIIGLNF